MKRFLFFLGSVLFPLLSFAQLDDFCSGDKGDPIFLETFGDQNTIADPSAIGTTTYTYINNNTPFDGEYTISSTFNWFPSWFSNGDHTEGDVRGKALIVNADDNTAGQFFEREISGLCPGTTYEFSTWLLNLTSLPLAGFCTRETGIPGGIPINVRFEIWDETGTIPLGSGDTGDIFSPQTPIWKQYGITFKSQVGQDRVILRILNNGVGGCGNDLALDDIAFASCGDSTILNTSLNEISPAIRCNDNLPGQVVLTVIPDFSVFSSHFYQWQSSSDGIVFTDIIGENNQSYTTPNLVLKGDYHYRVKIAETPVNLINDSCNSASDSYLIQIREKGVIPTLNTLSPFCESDEVVISVNSAPVLLVRWYDSVTSSKVLFEGNVFNAGRLAFGNYSFFAETYKTGFDCPSDRLEVPITVFGVVPVRATVFESICPNEEITIESSIENATYKWNTGETTKGINISQIGEFTVEIINKDGCSGKEEFVITEKAKPAKIKEILSQEDEIRIITEFEGSYEYSLNGIAYQNSFVFKDNLTGNYTAFVRDVISCNTSDQKDFFHLNIPKIFTPNADGIKDEFVVDEVKKVNIFNRYGKLIKQGLGGLRWDGTYIGKALASDSYWYLVETNEGGIFKGFVILKR